MPDDFPNLITSQGFQELFTIDPSEQEYPIVEHAVMARMNRRGRQLDAHHSTLVLVIEAIGH